MNPCPCGQLGTADRACTCPPGVPERYLRRVSGPLRDRIDLWVAVDRVPPATLIGPVAPEASAPGRRAHRGRPAAATRSHPARRRTGASGDARSGRSAASTTVASGAGDRPRGARGAVRPRDRAAAPRRADDRGPRGLGGRRDRPPRRGRPLPGAGGPDDDAGGGLMLGVGTRGRLAPRRDAPGGARVGGASNGTPPPVLPATDRPFGAAAADADDRERDAWVVLDAVQGVGPVSFARLIAAFGDARSVLRRGLRAARPGPARGRLRRARRRLAVALVGDREGRRGRSGRSRPAARPARPGGRAGRHAGRRRLPVEAAPHRAAAACALRLRIGRRARPPEVRRPSSARAGRRPSGVRPAAGSPTRSPDST